MKDTYLDSRKLTRNGQKTTIWAGRWGQLPIDDDPLSSLLLYALCSHSFTFPPPLNQPLIIFCILHPLGPPNLCVKKMYSHIKYVIPILGSMPRSASVKKSIMKKPTTTSASSAAASTALSNDCQYAQLLFENTPNKRSYSSSNHFTVYSFSP